MASRFPPIEENLININLFQVDDQDPYMPLSTIERPRITPGLAAGSISGIGTYGQHRGPRTMHTPPQTPPYHGTLNGHGSQSAMGVDLMLPTVQALRLGLTQPLHLEAMGMATEATTFHRITQNQCQILAHSEDIHSHIQLRK